MDELRRLWIVLIVPRIQVEVGCQTVCWCPLEQESRGHIIRLAERILTLRKIGGNPRIGERGRSRAILTGIAVLPAIAMDTFEGKAREQGIGDRTTDKASGLNCIETAIADISAGCKFLRRFRGNEVYGAARGVIAEQRALWTFKYFHSF